MRFPPALRLSQTPEFGGKPLLHFYSLGGYTAHHVPL